MLNVCQTKRLKLNDIYWEIAEKCNIDEANVT